MSIVNPSLRKVILSGQLGKRYGKTHRFALDTNTPAEAVAAMASQHKGFAAEMIGAKDHGIGYHVFVGDRNIGADELRHPVGNDDIRIVPVVMGSKNGGVFQVILGVVIIAASLVADYYTGGRFGEATNYSTYSMGAAMVLGGVVQLLTPTPKGLASKDKSANTPNYAFNGPLNTEAQGHPVPLLYGGPLKVGSAVISAGIDVRENSAAFQPPKTGEHHMGYGGDMNVGRSEL